MRFKIPARVKRLTWQKQGTRRHLLYFRIDAPNFSFATDAIRLLIHECLQRISEPMFVGRNFEGNWQCCLVGAGRYHKAQNLYKSKKTRTY
jgi:hypothetical protein